MSMEKTYKELDTSRDYLVDLIGSYEDSVLGGVSRDYSKNIALAIVDDVAQDIYECADHEGWSVDDVRLAVGRVLCARLKVTI